VKTTVEIPDAILRRAERLAAAKGVPLTQFLAESLEAKLREAAPPAEREEPDWMRGFGALADLKEENKRIAERIEQEFEGLEAPGLLRLPDSTTFLS
jgi:hypothetical protein